MLVKFVSKILVLLPNTQVCGDDVNCRNTNLNKDMVVAAVVMATEAVANLPEKKIRDFNGIGIHGVYTSALVFYQLGYEDRHIGSRPIC